MKNLIYILAVGLASTTFSFAGAVNKTCPVGSRPARTDITVKHEGKEVAFCCNNCKKKFEADPAKYADKIQK